MSKMPKRISSIEQLARVMEAGFARSATKADLEDLARMVQGGFDDVTKRMATKEQLQLVVDNLDLARADIHDIKLTLGPLVRHVAAMENMLRDHGKRIERLERKVGLTAK